MPCECRCVDSFSLHFGRKRHGHAGFETAHANRSASACVRMLGIHNLTQSRLLIDQFMPEFCAALTSYLQPVDSLSAILIKTTLLETSHVQGCLEASWESPLAERSEDICATDLSCRSMTPAWPLGIACTLFWQACVWYHFLDSKSLAGYHNSSRGLPMQVTC